jgi:hypothetical protein
LVGCTPPFREVVAGGPADEPPVFDGAPAETFCAVDDGEDAAAALAETAE